MQPYYHHSQAILDAYQGELPLQHFLKQYFATHKKLGSRDRKAIAEMCYCWYRASRALSGDADFETRIAAVLLLCDAQVPAARRLLPAAWQDAGSDFAAKEELLRAAGLGVEPERLLPESIAFSTGIDRAEWLRSMFRQPRLFLRIRVPRARVEARLLDAGLSFEWMDDHCLALPNGSKVEDVLPADSYVVQDASSQATGQFFRPQAGEAWWDVCCGAGGKSLLLADSGLRLHHTASDLRSSILHNLKARFERYGLRPPNTFAADATDAAALQTRLGGARFDRLLTDVPCTGSGTWARTPEQLYFFGEESLPAYAGRGVQIAQQAAHFLRPGGRLIYLTCSVFREENEAAVGKIAAATGLAVESSQLINGISIAADSLYAAVLH